MVLPVAGSGIRLLPVTKEQPKEMLPVFSLGKNGEKRVVPIIQLIFEQLYSQKFRDFCFIVGKKKRIIEDHFTPDNEIVKQLNAIKKNYHAQDLQNFFKKIEDSNFVWINQSQPKGFGHAVLQAKSYVKDERFLLHAGDTLLYSKNNSHIKKLIECHKKNNAKVSFIVQEIDDPKHYGIIDGKINGNVIHVKNLEEKPLKPKTNLAIMPVYIFEKEIFSYIEKIKPKKLDEIQLTTAIQNLVKDGKQVFAINLSKEMIQMDIGNPDSYWDSLNKSFNQL